MEKMLEYTKKYCSVDIIYLLKSIFMGNKIFVHMLKICQKTGKRFEENLQGG